MAYYQPRSLDEALDRLSAPAARAVAGGTDFYPALGAALPAGDVVDLTRVADLSGIVPTADGWRIGAAATWSDVIRADLPAAFDGLKAAAREVGSVQIQNAATVAGNLCNASPAADGVPPLLTLDAEVEIAGPSGHRRLPLSEFVTGVRATRLSPGEIVSAVHVPAPPEGATSAFLKLGSRRYLVISIAMAAALVWRDAAGRVAGARIALGACSPVARHLPALEAALVGRTAGEIAEDFVTDAHLDGLAPIDDIRGSAAYRREAARLLCQRVVRAALDTGAG